MSKKTASAVVMLSAMLGMIGCGGAAPGDEGSVSDGANDAFTTDPDDEVVDPSDPPTDPDPVGADELAASLVTNVGGTETRDELKAKCPKRPTTLSPKGLTFVIHISKTFGGEAYNELDSIKGLIRPRDIFMVEEKAPVLHNLRTTFPCNQIHFIAYPSQFAGAMAAADAIDGIAIDWELGVVNHSQAWSVDALTTYSEKIQKKGLSPSVVPAWPGFNDGHITRASKMDYELSQIQNHCADEGAEGFAAAAHNRVKNFQANGLTPRDIGFEISLDSYDFAAHHTDVERSVQCTRKGYGKGARAIYLYGNGHPALAAYFKAIEKIGLRTE